MKSHEQPLLEAQIRTYCWDAEQILIAYLDGCILVDIFPPVGQNDAAVLKVLGVRLVSASDFPKLEWQELYRNTNEET